MKPKFIISKRKVLEQFKIVEGICDRVSYSSKTNPGVTKILEENTGSMFSVHLENELKNVKDKIRVLFLAQAWNKEKIRRLIDMNVRSFVVDNENDLDEMISFLEENDEKVSLLLRVKLKENTIKTEKYFVFGMDAGVVSSRLLKVRENEKLKNKIMRLGVHFHRKTQNMAEWNLEYEFKQMFSDEVIDMIEVVNIVGGLPSEYANTNVDVINGVLDKIKSFKEFLNSRNIKMMIEPGRFIAAPSGKLITEIIGVYENNIIVNASVYNSDMDALIVPVKLKVEGEVEKNDFVKHRGSLSNNFPTHPTLKSEPLKNSTRI